MSKPNYSSLTNKNIQFLQGTQAQLNLYLANAPANFPNPVPAGVTLPTGSSAGSTNVFKGAAIEGAFYLTTDTHRLYVGRKSVSDGLVYPEEVSTGIATVANTGALTSAQTGGEAHDGDFYYIKDSNILAVYEENGSGGGEWVQINAHTAVNLANLAVSVGDGTANTTYTEPESGIVKITTSARTNDEQADHSAYFQLKAGENITLKRGADDKTIEISSANSQSTLDVDDSTDATNKASVVLSDGVNLDTEVKFVGAQDTTVAASHGYVATKDTTVVDGKTYYTQSGTSPNYTYTAVTGTPASDPKTAGYYEKENLVTITGPGVNGALVTDNTKYTASNDTTVQAGKTYYTYSGGVYTPVENPTGNPKTSNYYELTDTGFKIGVEVKNGGTAATEDRYLVGGVLDPVIAYGENHNKEAKFIDKKAVLDVYTIDETTAAINSAISGALQQADALHYKGTVEDINALNAEIDASNGTTAIEIGDTYKASGNFTINSKNVKTGDLLIAKGTEENGKITSASLTWDVVPSGDEPDLDGFAVPGADPKFGVEDRNITPSYGDIAADTSLTEEQKAAKKLLKRPLGVRIVGGTLISANGAGTDDNFEVTLNHTAPAHDAATAVTTVDPVSVIENNGVDTLGDTGKDKALAFTAIDKIYRDPYGHITKVEGANVQIAHNYVNKLTSSHTSNNNVGTIYIGAEDKFGYANSAVVNANRAAVNIGSSTLAVTAGANNTQLNIDLVWESF